MDVAELYGIVMDVPVGAHPDTEAAGPYAVRWHPALGSWCVLNTHIVLPVELAALVWEASMARWLIRQGTECQSRYDKARYTDPETGALGLLCGAHLVETSWASGDGFFAYLLPYNDAGEYIEKSARPDPDSGKAARPTRVEALAAACKALAPTPTPRS